MNVPHGGTVEVGQQPFVRVGVERHGVLDALHQILVLGTDERIASIGGVHVKPGARLVSDGTEFGQVVERHARRGAQGGGNEERHQSHCAVFLHGLERQRSSSLLNAHISIEWVDRAYLSQSGAAKAQVLVGIQDAQLDERDHGCLFDARVRLLGAVGDQFGQEDAFVDERVHRLELFDFLGAGGEQRDEDAFTCRRLHHAAALAVLSARQELFRQTDHLTCWHALRQHPVSPRFQFSNVLPSQSSTMVSNSVQAGLAACV